MGSATSNNGSKIGFYVAQFEYDRLKAAEILACNIDLEDYEKLPILSDENIQKRVEEAYYAAIDEETKSITDVKNCCVLNYRFSQLCKEEQREFCERVVRAIIAQEQKCFKPIEAAADYSKSFSGSAADTKAEKEAAALMKGEGGGEGEELKADTRDEEIHPYLRKPKLSCIEHFMQHDKAIMKNAGLYLKFLHPSGCFSYCHSITKEITSLRPSSYDEDDDCGGGIELANSHLDKDNNLDEKKGNIENIGEEIPEDMLVCNLSELPAMIDKIIDKEKRTPLILDTSEEQNVRTYFEYKARLVDISPLSIPFAKSGIKRSDIVENCRKTLVGALKSGNTFAFYMGYCTSEHGNWKKKMCKKDIFPNDTFVEGGKKILSGISEPRCNAIFRDDDKDENGLIAVRGDTFRTIVITALSPQEYLDKLGESIAIGYMQPLFIKH